MLETLQSWVLQALNYALSILPDSPITALDNSPVAAYLGIINWFMPISFFLSSMELWLTAIAVYYAISAILRWVKAIS